MTTKQENTVSVFDKAWTGKLVNAPTEPTPEPLTPLFDIVTASVSRFFKSLPPLKKFILSEVLPLGVVGMIVAPGATGKSMFAMQLAISVASGMTLAGTYPINESGSVLVLFAEDDEDEVHRRFRNAIDDMKPTDHQQELIESRLFIKSMVGEDNFMTTKQGGVVKETDYVQRLLLVAKAIPNLKLIIVDPASRYRGGEESDNDDATRFIIALEKLSKATGATVLFLHHSNKSSINAIEVNQGAARGASALTDGARWQMNLNTMTMAEAEEYGIKDHRMYVKVTVTKNNGARPQTDDIWLRRNFNGILSHVELYTKKAEDETDKTDKIIAATIRREAAIGEEYSVRGFCESFGGRENVIGIGDKGLRQLISKLIEDGTVAMVAPKTPRQNVKEVLSASEIA